MNNDVSSNGAVFLTVTRCKTEEGFRSTAYMDTAGHRTIGYGFNVDAGISQYAAEALLSAQLQELDNNMQKYDWYHDCDSVRQSVFLDMAFNEGLHGLLAYPHMIAATAIGDWKTAAFECSVKDANLDASRYAPLRKLLLEG